MSGSSVRIFAPSFSAVLLDDAIGLAPTRASTRICEVAVEGRCSREAVFVTGASWPVPEARSARVGDS